MPRKKQKFCKNGHRLSGRNLYRRKNGTRECRECSKVRGNRKVVSA